VCDLTGGNVPSSNCVTSHLWGIAMHNYSSTYVLISLVEVHTYLVQLFQHRSYALRDFRTKYHSTWPNHHVSYISHHPDVNIMI
jgi:hypothetical protein